MIAAQLTPQLDRVFPKRDPNFFAIFSHFPIRVHSRSKDAAGTMFGGVSG
jgi:hypothetical protein